MSKEWWANIIFYATLKAIALFILLESPEGKKIIPAIMYIIFFIMLLWSDHKFTNNKGKQLNE